MVHKYWLCDKFFCIIPLHTHTCTLTHTHTHTHIHAHTHTHTHTHIHLLCMFYDCYAEILEALNYSSLLTTSTSAQTISTIISTTIGEQFTKATTMYHASSVSSVGQQSTRPSVPYTSSVSSMKHATNTSANSGPQLPQGVLCI